MERHNKKIQQLVGIELTQGLVKSYVVGARGCLTLCYKGLVYEAWQYMSILNAEVVMGTKHIRWDNCRVATPIHLCMRTAKHTHTQTDCGHTAVTDIYEMIPSDFSTHRLWTSIILFA